MQAPLDDPAALARLAEGAEVVTCEIEHLPDAALDWAGGPLELRPRAEAIRIARDRLEEKTFLRRYLEVLAGDGAPAPDFDAAWRAYRRFAASGWVAAVATYAAGSRMQPLEVGRRAVARANATVSDLETATLLRQELGLPPWKSRGTEP